MELHKIGEEKKTLENERDRKESNTLCSCPASSLTVRFCLHICTMQQVSGCSSTLTTIWTLVRGLRDSHDRVTRVNLCFWEKNREYPLNLNARDFFNTLVHTLGINFSHFCYMVTWFEPLIVARSGRVFSTDPLHQLFSVPHYYGYVNS